MSVSIVPTWLEQLSSAVLISAPSYQGRRSIQSMSDDLSRLRERSPSRERYLILVQADAGDDKRRKVSWRRGAKGPLSASFAAVHVSVADDPPRALRVS